jgi:hypothetical protein
MRGRSRRAPRYLSPVIQRRPQDIRRTRVRGRTADLAKAMRSNAPPGGVASTMLQIPVDEPILADQDTSS